MEILAKKIEENGKIFATQNVKTHTDWVIEEALKLIETSSTEKVAKISGFSEDKILDLIFFSAYFHDIGKITEEFQSTILNGTKSYHPLYSASVLVGIEDFEYTENDTYINLLLITVLTHHTLFPYRARDTKFNFLAEAEDFFYGYKKSYEKYIKKSCPYDFEFEVDEEIQIEINAIEDDLKYIKSTHKLRILYSYVAGILNLADWLASAKFSGTKPKILFKTEPNKKDFIDRFSFEELKNFQKELSETHQTVLVEVPTGEGKTEGSLLWAVNNLSNNHSKIIYSLPTQTTSNKLYQRVQNFFNKDDCGLIHSSAKIYLEKEYEKENGKVDEIFKSDFLLSKSFNKPVTVSTIDSLLKYFINIGRFNIATKNFLNSVVIVDEVHAYDLKLMGFLKRFLELAQELEVKVCLMSASIPKQLKKLLGIENYPLINQKDLFKKKANQIEKIDNFLDKDLNVVLEKFHSNKNILVIRNSVKSAIETYKELLNLGVKESDIVLYHSTFKKIDRAKKEELIFKKLKDKKPFVLVATQIVEISLDIDFDVMFTDVAPIDSLIQRFGRVNRKKIEEKKGEIFIYKVENYLPYRENILNLTFETIENGYFELNKYVKWLNIVYDKLFEEDIVIKNEVTRLFEEGYSKYDSTIKMLNGIEKSPDNYNLRDIEIVKSDYLLYNDYINGDISYEFTVSLPIYLEKNFGHTLPKEKEKVVNFRILKMDYSFQIGVDILKEKEFESSYFEF